MRRSGLFIGIDRYQNGINTLRCSRNDAKSLSRYFAREFDEVNFLFDEEARSDYILNEVENMVDKLKAGDLFVFYFAGHGREFQGEHLLVGPTGRANAALYRQGVVSIPELLAASNREGVNRLFILDCCRSDFIAGRGETFACSAARDLSLRENVRTGNGLPPFIINSCSSGQQAFELENEGHGVFTKALLSVLRDTAKPVSDLAALLNRIDVKMQNLVPDGKQQWVSPIGNTNLWKTIPLFKSWEKKEAPQTPSSSPEKAKAGDLSASTQVSAGPEPVPVSDSLTDVTDGVWKTKKTASVVQSTEEQKLTAEEIKEYFRLSSQIKKFTEKNLVEADRVYLERELKAAEELYNKKSRRNACRRLEDLDRWCSLRERKYSLKQLEESIISNTAGLRRWLPDTFERDLKLAHEYWCNELWDEAEKEYLALQSTLQTAKAARKAEDVRQAEVVPY